MSDAFRISRAVRHLKDHPRDVEAVNALRTALGLCSIEQFTAMRGAQERLAHMAYRAAETISMRWEDEIQRANWIDVAAFLFKRLEKPKRLPKAKRKAARRAGEPVDVKKLAAGDRG